MKKEQRKLVLTLSAIIFVIFILAFLFSITVLLNSYRRTKNLYLYGETITAEVIDIRVETPLRAPWNRELFYIISEYKTEDKTYHYEERYTRDEGDYEFYLWCKSQIGTERQLVIVSDGNCDLAKNVLNNYKSAKLSFILTLSFSVGVSVVSAGIWIWAFFNKKISNDRCNFIGGSSGNA